MQTMRSEFEAKVAVGMSGSIAVMALSERQITIEGEVVLNGCDFAVKNDMEADSPLDWFHQLRDFGEAEEVGVYLVKGRVKFDEDSSDYYNVEISPLHSLSNQVMCIDALEAVCPQLEKLPETELCRLGFKDYKSVTIGGINTYAVVGTPNLYDVTLDKSALSSLTRLTGWQPKLSFMRYQGELWLSLEQITHVYGKAYTYSISNFSKFLNQRVSNVDDIIGIDTKDVVEHCVSDLASLQRILFVKYDVARAFSCYLAIMYARGDIYFKRKMKSVISNGSATVCDAQKRVITVTSVDELVGTYAGVNDYAGKNFSVNQIILDAMETAKDELVA